MRPDSITPSPSEASASSTERVIVDAIEELLQVDGLSGKSDIFDHGANSLTVQQLIWRLHDLFDLDIPLTVIFDAPTPRELAVKIDEIRHSNVAP